MATQSELLNRFSVATAERGRMVEARRGFPTRRQVVSAAQRATRGSTVVMEHSYPPFGRGSRHPTIG